MIVEDGAFIGSRCIVTEGVRVGAGAVLSANVSLTASVPIIDVTGAEPVEYRGVVPPRAVVVPGTRPKEFPAGHVPDRLRADHRLATGVATSGSASTTCSASTSWPSSGSERGLAGADLLRRPFQRHVAPLIVTTS